MNATVRQDERAVHQWGKGAPERLHGQAQRRGVDICLLVPFARWRSGFGAQSRADRSVTCAGLGRARDHGPVLRARDTVIGAEQAELIPGFHNAVNAFACSSNAGARGAALAQPNLEGADSGVRGLLAGTLPVVGAPLSASRNSGAPGVQNARPARSALRRSPWLRAVSVTNGPDTTPCHLASQTFERAGIFRQANDIQGSPIAQGLFSVVTGAEKTPQGHGCWPLRRASQPGRAGTAALVTRLLPRQGGDVSCLDPFAALGSPGWCSR